MLNLITPHFSILAGRFRPENNLLGKQYLAITMQNIDKSSLTKTSLYYPSAIIIDCDWTRQAILYSDVISSIIPDMDPNYPFSTEMKYLSDEGLYKPLYSKNFIHNDQYANQTNNLWEEFLLVINENKFIDFTTQEGNQNFSWPIYYDDIKTDWLKNVDQNGFFTQDDEDLDYFLFKKPYGLIYLSLMAKYMSQVGIDVVTPGTDMPIYDELSYCMPSQDKSDGMNIYFSNLLPVPQKNIPLEKIVKFKKENPIELYALRNYIKSFNQKIEKVETEQELKEILTDFHENIQVKQKILSNSLDSLKIDHFYSSLKSIVNLRSPTLLATTAFTTAYYTGLSEKLVAYPLGVTMSAIGTALVIEMRANWFNYKSKYLETLNKSEIAYLYYAERERII